MLKVFFFVNEQNNEFHYDAFYIRIIIHYDIFYIHVVFVFTFLCLYSLSQIPNRSYFWPSRPCVDLPNIFDFVSLLMASFFIMSCPFITRFCFGKPAVRRKYKTSWRFWLTERLSDGVCALSRFPFLFPGRCQSAAALVSLGAFVQIPFNCSIHEGGCSLRRSPTGPGAQAPTSCWFKLQLWEFHNNVFWSYSSLTTALRSTLPYPSASLPVPSSVQPSIGAWWTYQKIQTQTQTLYPLPRLRGHHGRTVKRL